MKIIEKQDKQQKLEYRRRSRGWSAPQETRQTGGSSGEAQQYLSKDLPTNLNRLKGLFNNTGDLKIREFLIGSSRTAGAVAYIDGLVDEQIIEQCILEPVMIETRVAKENDNPKDSNAPTELIKRVIAISEVMEVQTLEKLSSEILAGMTAILIDGFNTAVALSAKGWPKRNITTPETELVLRGPREGFTETLRDNLALVRRRLRETDLVIKRLKIGTRTQTDVVVLYIKGLTNTEIVTEVLKRLQSLDVDSVIGSSYLEHDIEDNWFSPFPQVQLTERPDVLSAELLQGRVGIIADNSPAALMVPSTLGNFFKSAGDYYHRWVVGSVIRTLRFTGNLMAIFLPGLYIALVSYHPGMIPSRLVLSVAATRQGVPFPAYLEAFLMLATLELLREAGARLPTPLGQTIGIVGGLVIGQAAVSAGLVSPLMVIVVAATAIASFAVPNYEVALSFRLMTFVFMILASIFGLLGLVLAFIGLLGHLVSLKSFGVPYMNPLAPTELQSLKDTLIRAPWPALKTRPGYLVPGEKVGESGPRKRGLKTAENRIK